MLFNGQVMKDISRFLFSSPRSKSVSHSEDVSYVGDYHIFMWILCLFCTEIDTCTCLPENSNFPMNEVKVGKWGTCLYLVYSLESVVMIDWISDHKDTNTQ